MAGGGRGAGEESGSQKTRAAPGAGPDRRRRSGPTYFTGRISPEQLEWSDDEAFAAQPTKVGMRRSRQQDSGLPPSGRSRTLATAKKGNTATGPLRGVPPHERARAGSGHASGHLVPSEPQPAPRSRVSYRKAGTLRTGTKGIPLRGTARRSRGGTR
jgi:hypothetical protein